MFEAKEVLNFYGMPKGYTLMCIGFEYYFRSDADKFTSFKATSFDLICYAAQQDGLSKGVYHEASLSS